MAYDNTKEFCKGLYFNETDLTKNIETSEKQFIFFKVSIRKKELIEYLESQNNDDDWINIDVKRSKTNKFYGEVNTYKPNNDNYNQDQDNENRTGETKNVSKHLKKWQQEQENKQKEQAKKWQEQENKQQESKDEIPF